LRTALFLAALLAAAPLAAQLPPAKPGTPPSPAEIVEAAPQADWTAIDPKDLLVMDLAPDAKGHLRRAVIQLLPAPFSQGWVGNVRKLAAAHWWDGLAVVRVQDNYVTQWGDPYGDDKTKARPLPAGLVEVPQSDYTSRTENLFSAVVSSRRAAASRDPYAAGTTIRNGWPTAFDKAAQWPVHCYGMVGVGRNMPPDTGTGAELYTVIGHAPRQLDRNIALVGRVIDGMEHLSSLPRGHGELGFYDPAKGDERVPILAVRLASEVKDLPAYEYLSTESASFARYADARANRRDAFYLRPAGGVDVCNVPVPVRRAQ